MTLIAISPQFPRPPVASRTGFSRRSPAAASPVSSRPTPPDATRHLTVLPSISKQHPSPRLSKPLTSRGSSPNNPVIPSNNGHVLSIIATLRADSGRNMDVVLRTIRDGDKYCSKSPQFCAQFVAAGGADCLLKLVASRRQDPAVLATGSRLLRTVIKGDAAAHAALMAAGGIHLVQSWLAAHREHVSVQLCALLLIQAILEAPNCPAAASDTDVVVAEAQHALQLFSSVPQVHVAVFTMLRARVQGHSPSVAVISECGLMGELLRCILQCIRLGYTQHQSAASEPLSIVGATAVIQQGCLFLAAAADADADLPRQLFSLGALDLVERVLTREPAVVEEQSAALELLSRLMLLPEALSHSVSIQLQLRVLSTVRAMWGHMPVAIAGFHALWLMCSVPSTAASLTRNGLMGTLLAALKQFDEQVELLVHVLRTMTNILAVIYPHDELATLELTTSKQVDVTDQLVMQMAQDLPVILDVIQKHLANPKLASAACIVLAQFASREIGKQTAIEHNALQLTVSVLQQHLSHPEALHDGLGLLINLTVYSTAVQHSVTRLGGTRLLLRVLQQYSQNFALLAKVCWALSNLVCNRNAENQNTLLRHHALAAVLDTVRQHSSIASVVVRAVAFFSNVLEGSEEVAKAAVPLSVLPTALEWCGAHESVAGVMQHGCALLANMVDAGGRLVVPRAKGLRFIKCTLDLHVEDAAAAAQVALQQPRPLWLNLLVLQACRALHSVLSASSEDSDNPLLRQIGTDVLMAVQLHETAPDVLRGWILAALSALVLNGVMQEVHLGPVLEQLVEWFRDPSLSAAVCEQGAVTIHAICSRFPQLLSAASRVLQPALALLKQDVSHSTLSALCKLIGVLVDGAAAQQLMVVQQGGVADVLQVLQVSSEAHSSELLLVCCDTLCKVCTSSSEASAEVAQQLSVISEAISRMESADVTARACDVVSAVADAQRDLSAADVWVWTDVCGALVEAMKKYPQNESVQVAAIVAMAAIGAAGSGCSTDLLTVMSDMGAVAVILSAMRAFTSLIVVQVACASAIARFCTSQHHKAWLGQHGAIDLLVQAMHQSLWKDQLQIRCLQALQAITSDCVPNAEIAARCGVLQQVLWSMQVHCTSHKAVALLGCNILWVLAQAPQMVSELVADEVALDMVLNCMNEHSKSAGIVQHSSHALAVLVKASPSLQALVLAKDGLTSVATSSTTHLGNADTSTQLLLTCAALSCGCDENRHKLVEEGALGSAVAAMQVHASSVEVQQAGCLALAAITASDPAAQEEAQEHGAVEVVVASLKAHQHHMGVMRECCVALSKICKDCTSAAVVALSCEAPKLLVVALARYSQSPDTLEVISSVLRILSSCTAGVHSFAEANGFVPLLEALHSHSSQSGLMQEACGLICNVTRGHPKYQEEFARQGGIPTLLQALDASPSVNVQSCLFASLGCLLVNHKCVANDPQLPKRTISLVIQAMCVDDAECLANCSFALSSVCFADPENIKLICEKNGMALVLNAMRNYQDNKEVQLYGCLFITGACTSVEALIMATKLSAVKQLLLVLSKFVSDSQMVREVARALCVLLKNHKNNQEAFTERGGVGLIMNALRAQDSDVATAIELVRLGKTAFILSSSKQGETPHLLVIKQMIDDAFTSCFDELPPVCRANRTVQAEVLLIMDWVAKASVDLLDLRHPKNLQHTQHFNLSDRHDQIDAHLAHNDVIQMLVINN